MGRWVDLQARMSSKGWIGTDRDRIVTPQLVNKKGHKSLVGQASLCINTTVCYFHAWEIEVTAARGQHDRNSPALSPIFS